MQYRDELTKWENDMEDNFLQTVEIFLRLNLSTLPMNETLLLV